MRVRALLLIPALAATALLGVGAGGASAATLFTTTAHTTRVTVGATAVMTGLNFTQTSGTSVIDNCPHVRLNLTLVQNNDAEILFHATSGAFNACTMPKVPTFDMPWQLTVAGSGTVRGPNTCWDHTRLDNVRYDLLGGTYSGSLTTGMTLCQPTSSPSPLTLFLDAAGTIVGPLTGNGRYDGQFVMTGTAAAWSLTN